MFIDGAWQQPRAPQGGFDYLHGQMFLHPDPPAGGGAPPAGGGTPPAFTPPDVNDPAVKQWLQQQTAGVVANRDTILQEKRQLATEFEQFKQKIAPIGDVDKALKLFEQFQSDEEKKLISAGRVDEVINLRTRDMQTRHQKAQTEWQEKEKAAMAKADGYLKRVKELTIDRTVAEAAVKVGVQKTALPDVIARARSVFKLKDDDLSMLAVDGQGNPILGRDGKTPKTADEWLEDLKTEAPHFFPMNGGAGSGGGPAPGGTGQVIRLRPGYTQKEYEQAKEQAEKTGASIQFPPAA